MLNRIVRRSFLDPRIASCARPSAFAPLQSRFISGTPAPTPEHDSKIEPLPTSTQSIVSLSGAQLPQKRATLPTAPVLPTTPPVLDDSMKTMLPLLTSQSSHYLVAHIHGKRYLVTEGDQIRLPFRMPGVVPGDVLRLNRASIIGSRDYTMKGAPYLDERLFVCRATVTGTESEPLRLKEKTKRRQRKVKTVKSKGRFTILRVSEFRVKELEEVTRESETVSV